MCVYRLSFVGAILAKWCGRYAEFAFHLKSSVARAARTYLNFVSLCYLANLAALPMDVTFAATVCAWRLDPDYKFR